MSKPKLKAYTIKTSFRMVDFRYAIILYIIAIVINVYTVYTLYYLTDTSFRLVIIISALILIIVSAVQLTDIARIVKRGTK